MESTRTQRNGYRTGGIGTPSAGADRGCKAGPATSSSSYRGATTRTDQTATTKASHKDDSTLITNMEGRKTRGTVYRTGGFGTPSAGANGGGRAGPLASSSSNRGMHSVEHQAESSRRTTGKRTERKDAKDKDGTTDKDIQEDKRKQQTHNTTIHATDKDKTKDKDNTATRDKDTNRDKHEDKDKDNHTDRDIHEDQNKDRDRNTTRNRHTDSTNTQQGLGETRTRDRNKDKDKDGTKTTDKDKDEHRNKDTNKSEDIRTNHARTRTQNRTTTDSRTETWEELEDPTEAFSRSSREALPCPQELRDELRTASTGELGHRILESVRGVERVSVGSKNLKGTFVRELRIAAQTTRLACMELLKRSNTSSEAEWLEKENGQLRDEVRALRREVAELKERLQFTRPPPREHPSSPSSRSTPRRQGQTREEHRMDTQEHIETRMEKLMNTMMGQVMDAIERKFQEMRKEIGHHRRVDTPQRPQTHDVQETRRTDETVHTRRDIRDETDTTQMHQQPTHDERTDTRDNTEWTQVTGHRRKSGAIKKQKKKKEGKKTEGNPQKERKQGQHREKGKDATKRKQQPRQPKTAAVTITMAPDAQLTYAQAVAEARTKINLEDLGIQDLRVRHRRAITGGLVLEIPGPDGGNKAEALATKMAEVLEGKGARVARPVKRTEIRLRGLDDSVTPQEVAGAIAASGGCKEQEVRTGKSRTTAAGTSSMWVQCPVTAAKRILEEGSLRVGWSTAKVEALERRQLQCYRCLGFGHVRQRCTDTVDRSALCYRCGDPTHKARDCQADPRCPLCADQGRPAAHRLGSAACVPASRPTRNQRTRQDQRGSGRLEEADGRPADARREEAPRGVTPPPTPDDNLALQEEDQAEEEGALEGADGCDT